MSDKTEKDNLNEDEEMLKEIQSLQLKEKRMMKLMDQRKQERSELEAECCRMEKHKKHMEDMVRENMEAKKDPKKEEQTTQLFTGIGNRLGDVVSPAGQKTDIQSVVKVKPVEVDKELPVGQVQVRLEGGQREVVVLNLHHSVGHLVRELRARTGEGRQFNLVTMGPPAKVLDIWLTIKEAGIVGGAVMQRF